MRFRTGFSVMLLSGLACVGVPSAAIGDLVPTPSTTIEGGTTTGATAGAPTPTSSDAPETESTVPAVEDTAAPTGDAAEPEAEETPVPAPGAAAESTDETDQTEPADEVLEPAAEEVTRDPRASIGDVSCSDLTVPVTLDNSRSTVTATYLLLAGDIDGEDYSFTRTFEVPAGVFRHLDVPVTDDSMFVFDVSDGGEPPQAGQLAFAVLTVDCSADDEPQDPQARIGDVDCTSKTVDVTLDNSRSDAATTYLLTTANRFDDESYTEQTVEVAAGDVETVSVPVAENTALDVFIDAGGEEGTFLAYELFRVDCTAGDEPRASFGAVSCTDLTVAVTLDNTRSPSPTTFVVLASATEGEEYFEFYDTVSVPAGEQRTAHVRVPNNAEVTLIAADEDDYDSVSATLAWENRAVDCERPLSRRAVPRTALNVGVLAATGTNGLAPLFGGVGLLVSGGVLTLLGLRRRPTI